MLRSDLSFDLFASPFFTLFLASFLVVTVALATAALSNLTFLPLDGFRTWISAKLRFHCYNTSSDCVTLPTRFIAL